MHTFIHGGESPKATEAGRRAPKVNNACGPCRARKVKCDAAVVGLPCSSCKSRQSAEDCIPLARKARLRARRKGPHALSSSCRSTGSPTTSDHPGTETSSKPHSASDGLCCPNPDQTEPDLLYLRILCDSGEKTSKSNQLHSISDTPYRPKLKENITPRNCLSTKFSYLDEIDREYLAKKGVFDLPPPQQLDILVKTYFDHVHALTPVISRADFIPRYQSGDCPLLLLRVMLTVASLHAPAEVLLACGFASRSAAQESFFAKVSILLCLVILDHQTDRDFGYWFQNAIRLANKLSLRDIVMKSTKPPKVLKLYRRIWWSLYSLDVFQVFVNTSRSRLLQDNPDIKPLTEDDWEDDWEDEDVSERSSGLLSTVTPQQKASPVVQCELSRIFGECLSFAESQPQQDPRQIMQPLDAWRRSLTSKMHVGNDIGINVRLLSIQAMSFRFECMLCRLLRRISQHSGRPDWSDWIKQRFRSALLELDTISMRVLASGTIEGFSTPFITTITALLAFHIESVLDESETHLVRSMSRISISQTMLVLVEGREIPVFKRALPIFEEILIRNNLHLIPSNSLGQSESLTSARLPPPGNAITDAYVSPHTKVTAFSPRLEQWEHNPVLDTDFLGFDFLDEWQQIEPLDFPGSS